MERNYSSLFLFSFPYEATCYSSKIWYIKYVYSGLCPRYGKILGREDFRGVGPYGLWIRNSHDLMHILKPDEKKRYVD